MNTRENEHWWIYPNNRVWTASDFSYYPRRTANVRRQCALVAVPGRSRAPSLRVGPPALIALLKKLKKTDGVGLRDSARYFVGFFMSEKKYKLEDQLRDRHENENLIRISL